MAALTADKIVLNKGLPTGKQEYPVATATTIYAGALVCINASGYAIPATDTAGLSECVGVAVAQVVNAGANGAASVLVEFGSDWLLDAAAGITQADVGRSAHVVDDQTVTDAAAATNDIRVGVIRGYVAGSPNKAWVHIEGGR